MAILLFSCSDEQGNGTTTIRELSGGSDGSGYILTISSTNGTVTKSPNKASYNAGDSVTLVAVPANGYKFSGWSGGISVANATTTIVIDSNLNVTANFRFIATPNIPIIAGAIPGNGSIILSWNNVIGATSYNIYYSTGSTVTKSGTRIESPASPDTIIGLTNGTQYAFAISSIGIDGESELSSVSVVALQLLGPTQEGMTLLNGGTFQMGQLGIAEPIHQVTISSFYIDTTEVTQADYFTLMGVNPSKFIGDSKLPVEQVTWFDAVLYCNKRSKRDRKDTVYLYTGISGIAGNGCSNLVGLTINYLKKGYRLLTEAEWEYSCRAGTTTKCFWGDDSSAGGNYSWSYINSGSITHIVATKKANPWGLYDITGNVWNWCNDWFGNYSSSVQVDPVGANSGTSKVTRGDCCRYPDIEYLRSACRANYSPSVSNAGDRYIGFRVLLPAQ